MMEKEVVEARIKKYGERGMRLNWIRFCKKCFLVTLMLNERVKVKVIRQSKTQLRQMLRRPRR